MYLKSALGRALSNDIFDEEQSNNFDGVPDITVTFFTIFTVIAQDERYKDILSAPPSKGSLAILFGYSILLIFMSLYVWNRYSKTKPEIQRKFAILLLPGVLFIVIGTFFSLISPRVNVLNKEILFLNIMFPLEYGVVLFYVFIFSFAQQSDIIFSHSIPSRDSKYRFIVWLFVLILFMFFDLWWLVLSFFTK